MATEYRGAFSALVVSVYSVMLIFRATGWFAVFRVLHWLRHCI